MGFKIGHMLWIIIVPVDYPALSTFKVIANSLADVAASKPDSGSQWITLYNPIYKCRLIKFLFIVPKGKMKFGPKI